MCLYRPRSKSGVSPYWAAQFRSCQGKVISIGTKIRDKRTAKRLESVWVRCAELSRNGWLTIDKAKDLLEECGQICRGDSLKQSESFIDSCLRQSIGSALLVPTVEGYIRDWLASKTELGRNSQGTMDRYKPVLERFLVFLATRRSARLDSITPTDCAGFLRSEKARGIGAETANQGIRIVRVVLNSAQRQGLISTNPANAVELYEESPHKRQAFSIEQVRALLAVADPEWTGLILLGFYAGVRLGDGASMTWGNIDRQNNLLVFRAQKTCRRKEDTVIDLHRDLVNYLDSLQPGTPAAPLFPGLSSRAIGSANGLSARFRRLMDKAGIFSPSATASGSTRVFRTLSFHSLRHLYITQLSRAGVPIEIRRELAGHSSDEMSLGYTHVDRERTAGAINQLPSVKAA